MIIFQGLFSYYDKNDGNVGAEDQMMTLICPTVLELGERVHAYWQWSQKESIQHTKVNASLSGFVDGIDSTSKGGIRVTLCRQNTTSLEAVKENGSDFSKLKLALKPEDHTIDPDLSDQNLPFEVRRVYYEPPKGKSLLRDFWMSYIGKLTWSGNSGTSADREAIIFCLPMSFEEDDPVILFSRWTQTKSGDVNQDFQVNGTVKKVQRNDTSDVVTLILSTSPNEICQMVSVELRAGSSTATISLSIEGSVKITIPMSVSPSQQTEPNQTSDMAVIPGRTSAALLNDSEEVVWVTIANASENKNAFLAALAVGTAAAACVVSVIAPPLALTWALNLAAVAAAGDSVYSILGVTDDKVVEDRPLFPGDTVVRKIWSIHFDEQKVGISWWRNSEKELQLHEASKVIDGTEIVKVSDLRRNHDYDKPSMSFTLDNVSIPTYHALLWLPGFAIIDSRQKEGAPINLLKKPIGSVFHQEVKNNQGKEEKKMTWRGILYGDYPTLGFGVKSHDAIVYNMPVDRSPAQSGPQIRSVQTTLEYAKSSHHSFLRMTKYRVMNPSGTIDLGTANNEKEATSCLSSVFDPTGCLYVFDPEDRSVKEFRGYPAYVGTDVTQIIYSSSSKLILFLSIAKVSPLMDSETGAE